MVRSILFTLALALSLQATHSQVQIQTQSQSSSLYMPRNIANAIKKGTRSIDGSPGSRYWQNRGRYNISVTVAPPDRTVKGSEQIVYINNSPDTLRSLAFKLIVNIHKPGVARYGTRDSGYLTQGVQIDTYKENGKTLAWSSDNDGTAKGMRLTRPVAPHDSVRLSFDWHYTVSLESDREGMIDSTTFFLAYFYPRVAVYDDYNGWDMLDFIDGQEFYNDFNDYTLNVTVPKNFISWATGTLQNPDAVLMPAFAKKLATSMTTDNILHIATLEDLKKGIVTRQNTTNTWLWTAADISDMTIGVSDHFVWDASSVVVDKSTGRRASVQAAYNDTAKDFHQMVEFGRHSLEWLSNNWPGIPYPFPKTTIFQGYADMEYPMMVNDGTNEDPVFSRFVVEHEIAHTWFPFYMGTNESRYAFMDEGWATTFELLIGREDLGVEKAENFYKQFRVYNYTYDPSTEEDLPIITPSNVLKGVAYGNNSYGKPSLAYLAVKDLLGDELFKKCLHEYMALWHGKHPIPWDFFYSFDKSSGKDLNWFWTNWFFSNNYIDLAIEQVDPDQHLVSIRNVGGFAIPFDVIISYTDGSSEKIHETPAIWSADQKNARVTLPSARGKQIGSILLNGGIYVDANASDNRWNSKN